MSRKHVLLVGLMLGFPVVGLVSCSTDVLSGMSSVGVEGAAGNEIVDAYGRILTIEPSTETATYAFDERGRLAKVTYGDGETDTYAYDDAIETVEVSSAGADGIERVLFVYRVGQDVIDAQRLDFFQAMTRERTIDLTGETYKSLFSGDAYQSGAILESVNYPSLSSGDCICQYGNTHGGCAGSIKRLCTSVDCSDRQNTACVWRGSAAKVDRNSGTW